ncbi:NmrA family NAD(P)-binding protein [Bacillus haynesii]|uniref:NmrA family NAD(P)-binding protein n=1 Tax=Bacillus haynesii TaxID=1925021 RepID=UPI0003EDA39F|nr:NmrA family NAD(P)-binding protein [Bacillus haynesii]EWH23030.1 epimerase [Bacillus haynesii]
MYVITGATGRTGSAVANYLLDKGQRIRVIGRNPERLQPFVRKGAEPFVSEPGDATRLMKAFTGAKAVYVMLQPNYIVTSTDFRAYQTRIINALIPALAQTKVKNVVSLSSWGADKEEGTGPVAGLHLLEQRLNQIEGLNVLHLRAGYFMENLLSQIQNILIHDAAKGPFLPDVQFPMVSTRDIGQIAGEAMLKVNHQDQQIRELHGSCDLSMSEAVRLIGKAIGKPNLGYIQTTEEAARNEMRSQGFSEHIIDLVLETAHALNTKHIRMLEQRSSENTTPTSFDTFINEVFIPQYENETRVK